MPFQLDNRILKYQLLKGLFKANRCGAIEQLPELQTGPFEVQPAEAQVDKFNQLTGWQDKQFLAPTWLQVSAFPTYLNLLSDPSLPFSPLGLVHIENQIRVLKPLPANSRYQLQCKLGHYQGHRKGVLFDITLEARVSNELVYEGRATNLIRLKIAGAQKSSQATAASTPADTSMFKMLSQWMLKANEGRRYASVSGDYNPIHLFPLSARLFGFQRPIAHGMYLKAKCLSAILAQQALSSYSATMTFRKPVMLPGQVSLKTYAEAEQTHFFLAHGDASHASGAVTAG